MTQKHFTDAGILSKQTSPASDAQASSLEYAEDFGSAASIASIGSKGAGSGPVSSGGSSRRPSEGPGLASDAAYSDDGFEVQSGVGSVASDVEHSQAGPPTAVKVYFLGKK